MAGNSGAVAYTDESAPTRVQSRRPYNDRPVEKPIRDAVTDALGEEFYYSDKQFDQLREPLARPGGQDTGEGYRFIFVRWYPKSNVLVDFIPVDTEKDRRTVDQKRKALIAWNKKHKDEPEKQFGYLPVFVFQRVFQSTFDAVLKKKILELPEETEEYRLARNPVTVVVG